MSLLWGQTQMDWDRPVLGYGMYYMRPAPMPSSGEGVGLPSTAGTGLGLPTTYMGDDIIDDIVETSKKVTNKLPKKTRKKLNKQSQRILNELLG